jgi:hypothetical protein
MPNAKFVTANQHEQNGVGEKGKGPEGSEIYCIEFFADEITHQKSTLPIFVEKREVERM